MSSSVVASYDRVFDSQRHFRTMLDCTARPGTIGLLDDVPLELEPGLNKATALVALALLNPDVSFHAGGLGDAVDRFVQRQTLATRAPVDEADFLFLDGADSTESIDRAKSGTPSYPDAGATVLLQVSAISSTPLPEALSLTLTGPGIPDATTVFVSGLNPEILAALERQNCEFPIGVDAILTCADPSAGPRILSLPRTTKATWTQH